MKVDMAEGEEAMSNDDKHDEEQWERYNNWMRAIEPWFVMLVIFSPFLLLAAAPLIAP